MLRGYAVVMPESTALGQISGPTAVLVLVAVTEAYNESITRTPPTGTIHTAVVQTQLDLDLARMLSVYGCVSR